MDWLLGLLANVFARMFKDWRRDQSLEEKGRADQRNDDFQEGERRRRDADVIKRETEGEDVVVEDDEL